ncbi:hypothetical protein [Phenylobacterium sp.]|uniref:hypothetical protein n=1 Tax=Phenylobacterium sp. TaxID=1871053 RepID=UPI00286E348E|nr:hypothetical protein [Phenylobacterium sp.]
MRRSREWIPTVTDFISACSDRYFITLTTKRRVGAQELSRFVGECFHRVNTKLFGPKYGRRKKLFLATYVVHESNFDQGLHAHVLIGVPDGALHQKANPYLGDIGDLIIRTWCNLDHGGRGVGQDVQAIGDFNGALRYVNKHVFSLGSFDAVDVLNTRVPNINETAPLEG